MPIPHLWTRAAAWPDDDVQQALIVESRPGIVEVSTELLETLLRSAGFTPTETIVLPPAEPVTHQCPPRASATTPCCERTPFELSPTDRITIDPALVTCRGAERTS